MSGDKLKFKQQKWAGIRMNERHCLHLTLKIIITSYIAHSVCCLSVLQIMFSSVFFKFGTWHQVN